MWKSGVGNPTLGLDVKNSVRVTTTANINLTNTQTIDGVDLVAGNRVLVKNQTTASQNGIYKVASGNWSRTTDMATGSFAASAFTFVEEGTVNADNGFICTTNSCRGGVQQIGTPCQDE